MARSRRGMRSFKSFLLLILLVLMILTMTNYIINIPQYHHSIAAQQREFERRLQTSTPRSEPLKRWEILLYTGLFFQREWKHVPFSKVQNYTSIYNCPVKNCIVTYDRSRITAADALLFHCIDLQGPTENSAKSLKKLSLRYRNSTQRWIFLCHEPPVFTWKYNDYDGLFNWTMTFLADSDIYFPYFHYEETNHRIMPKDYVEGKTGIVAWVVSHCGLLRERYVLQLEKYISVDVYGQCSDRYKNSKGIFRGQLNHLISKYKFYLAFENSPCKDYITEKYWSNALGSNSVPVVMGSYFNTHNSIPGSYIHVDDFKSPKHLAQYLLYLNGNNSAYNEYFSWKQKFQRNNGKNLVCQICSALEQWRSRRKSILLSKFWNPDRSCSGYFEKAKKSLETNN